MDKELTYGDIVKFFFEQFPGIDANDVRPNGQYQIYVWLNQTDVNLIATYKPDMGVFHVETTYEKWKLLDK